MNMQNGHRSPEDIEAAIQRTRTDLDETLTQLEHSLTPGQLIDQGMDYMRNSSAKEYLSNLSASAKRDPIPLALVGVGLAWLMASGRRQDKTEHSAHRPHAVGDAARAAGQRAGEMGDSALHKVHDLTESAVQKAHDLSDSARQTARQLRDSARDKGERLRSGYEHVLAEQPLVVGAVGLAIGAIFAAMVPRTEQEERLLGSRSGSESGSGSAANRAAGGDGFGDDNGRNDMFAGMSPSTSHGSTGSMHGTGATGGGADSVPGTASSSTVPGSGSAYVSASSAPPGTAGSSASSGLPGTSGTSGLYGSPAAGVRDDPGRAPGSETASLQSPRSSAPDTASGRPPGAA